MPRYFKHANVITQKLPHQFENETLNCRTLCRQSCHREKVSGIAVVQKQSDALVIYVDIYVDTGQVHLKENKVRHFQGSFHFIKIEN